MGGVSNTSTTPERPTHVAVACAIAVVCSVLVVVSAWDTLGSLHTIVMRQRLESAIRRAGVQGSGITLSDLTLVLRVVTIAVACCAAAVAVLSVETMRRSRGARVAMTALAVPVFLGGLVSGGIFSTAVAAAVSTLWYGPARAWFDGVPGRDGAPRQAPAAPPPRPRPDSPELRPQAWSPSGPPSSPQPPASSSYDVHAARFRRPVPLLVACLLTWLSCALAALVGGATVLVLAVDSQGILDRTHARDPQLAGSGLSDHAVIVAAFVMGSLVLVWSVAAAVVAVLAFQRRRWAWHTLLGSTAAVVVLSVLAVLGSAVVLVPVAAALVTIVLLLRPEVRAWFSG
jgi:hypothetical protein